jgi:transcriptional regulator with XRE-family HTH domain
MGRCGKNTAMKIGSRIARARHAAGLSQTELAKLIGVNRGTVAQWEVHIKGPNRDLMMKIASATFVPVASLLSDTAPGDFIVTDRDEIAMLRAFRRLSEEQRKHMTALLGTVAELSSEIARQPRPKTG